MLNKKIVLNIHLGKSELLGVGEAGALSEDVIVKGRSPK